VPVEYPIRAAAKLTGISVDTLRAWERRYNAVIPARTERGRLYDERAIRRLLLLKSAVESGRSIGQVASLPDAELEELERNAQSFSRKPEIPSPPEPATPVLQPLLDAIGAYDYAAANDELGRLALLLHPNELVHRVVLPLMRLTGENWENGVFQIAQEHMLSGCVRNLLGGLVRLQKGGPGAHRMLFTTPPGELHEFGILAASLLAVGHEFEVAYLGPNLPAREVLQAVAKSWPHAVVLGIMKTNAMPTVVEEVRLLAAELPSTTELWLGGSGASTVSNGLTRDGLLVLQDLTHFERHLTRLKATFSRESIL
jgi:DNA-binding transcriptional MerR regulator